MIEHLPYKDYTLDLKKNKSIYFTLLEFDEICQKKNIPYLIGGSLALTLYYKKIYRTLKDIDLNVNIQLYNYLKEIFKNELVYQRATRAHILFTFPKTNVEIDFATYLYRTKENIITTKVEFYGKIFNILHPDLIWYFREEQNTKVLDFEDFNFFSQFDKKLRIPYFKNFNNIL
jgi:hypothetical protein